MSINLIRKPTETPSINPSDDARIFRYACGGYDRGVIKNYGNECSYTINGRTFIINSGEIIIDGYQTEIRGLGESLTVDNISGNQYYVVYCETNLSVSGNEKSEIKYIYDTAVYPTITDGDDLTQIKTGIARMVLYKFKASSGVISNVEKQFNIIEYGVVKNSNNVKETINGHNITDIFENNGTTVKAAKNIVTGGTIASDVTGVTQTDYNENTKKRLATLEYLYNELEKKMNKYELLATPNTSSYNVDNIANFNNYKFLKVYIQTIRTTHIIGVFEGSKSAITVSSSNDFGIGGISISGNTGYMRIYNNNLQIGKIDVGNYSYVQFSDSDVIIKEIWGQK